jgi:ApaG protein
MYALLSLLADIKIRSSSVNAFIERQIREDQAAQGRAMMKLSKINEAKQKRQYEEDLRNPGMRAEKEANERRESTMRKILDQIEEENKKKLERAKEMLGQIPDFPETRTKSMEKAIKDAREEFKNLRRKQMGRPVLSSDGSNGDDDESGGSSRKSSARKAREAAEAEAAGGRPRVPGDKDVSTGDLAGMKAESSATAVTGPLQVEVTSVYNQEQSDPPMRKHCFQYTIRITNNSENDTFQLLGRRFEIQTVGSSMKDIVQGEGVTGRTPVLKPGEVFEYTSTAPLSVRPIGTTEIAARMSGEYRYVTLQPGQDTASEEQIKSGGDATATLGTFHFIFPEDQRVKPYEDDDDDTPKTSGSSKAASSMPASTVPGDADMTSGDLTGQLNDTSDTVAEMVRVHVSTTYRPERSDVKLDKHCFAYNIRITNESNKPIQILSRNFEIQTIGSPNKDLVQGPGVTGRQPILKPGESFEYTSMAPLSVKPMSKTPVLARMSGTYNFVRLADDGTTPVSSTPLQAKMGVFHFILPQMA